MAPRVTLFYAILLLVASALACATPSREKRVYAYPPADFEAAMRERVPEVPDSLARAPYLVDEETLTRARRAIRSAPRGPDKVFALVDFLMTPEPKGLGLVYDWSATGSAEITLARHRGNCVSLASVLVGIGRGLGWPVFYAEARTRKPETQEFEQVRALSDHMAVLITAKTTKMVIDFTGLLDEVYSVEPIDDLTAYAHMLNNVSAQLVLTDEKSPDAETWGRSVQGFELATRVQPSLGRAWNNLGIALTRLERYDEARVAYQKAVELDTAFGSAEHNLTMMETRAAGGPKILRQGAVD